MGAMDAGTAGYDTDNGAVGGSMAAIKSAYVRKRESGKIYLSGYADGLETGYNYCIQYQYMGGELRDVGNKIGPITYIKLDGLSKGLTQRYEFRDNDVYVADDGDGVYSLLIYMVGRDCDDKHILEDRRMFSVEPEDAAAAKAAAEAAKLLTPEEADERIRAGLPCYIKCTLPILDLLPGIPYTPGAWVPPFCVITTEP